MWQDDQQPISDFHPQNLGHEPFRVAWSGVPSLDVLAIPSVDTPKDLQTSLKFRYKSSQLY
jgi:hypothetical protein